MLNTFTPRAKKVVCLRYGIGLTQDYTLEEVGWRFDVTRERIRQIEAKALRNLKHPSRGDTLRELIGYYQTTAEKKAEEESARTRWEKAREAAQQRDAARAQAKVDEKIATHNMIAKADRELRQKWEEIKPMVSDVEWVKHLRTADPTMYQELKYMVGDIWGKNAKIVWEMYAEKEKRK